MLDASPTNALEILRTCPALQVAPSADLERLASNCTVHRYRRGATVLQRGAVWDSLMVLGRGRLKITALSPDAKGDLIVGLLRPGDVFGELSVFHRLPMIAVLQAVSESEAVFVPRADLMALMERRPAVAVALLEVLCEKLRLAVDMIVNLRFLDMPSRLFRRLQLLGRLDARREGPAIRIQHGLSQQELADSIGASREALNKLLSEWRREGLVEYGRGYVVVVDGNGLLRRLPAQVRQHNALGPLVPAVPRFETVGHDGSAH